MINPLSSVAPLIILTLRVTDPLAGEKQVSGLLGDIISFAGGIPIPIYLDENVTGICLESEERTIAIETLNQQDQRGNKLPPSQRGVSANLTINLTANKTSLFLQILLALAENAFELAVAKGYSISYFHNGEVIINGLLANFVTSGEADTDKMKIQITLQKGEEKGKLSDTDISARNTVPNTGLPSAIPGG